MLTEDIRFLTDRALWETENLMKPGDPLYQNPEFHTKDLADLTDLKDEQLGEKPEVQIRNYLY